METSSILASTTQGSISELWYHLNTALLIVIGFENANSLTKFRAREGEREAQVLMQHSTSTTCWLIGMLLV